jgi:L-asparaginase
VTNILLVFTGGTIGSVASGGTIQPSETPQYQLLQQFRQALPEYTTIAFHIIQPLQILSENLAPDAWTLLVDTVKNARPEQFDGVIITHGTDTLAYSAAALSFCFAGCPVPLLLVSSDYPLADVRANGLANFICAVEYILQIGAGGVFVPYRNDQRQCEIHQGARLSSSLQLGSDFYSVQGRSHLIFTNGQFVSSYPGHRYQLEKQDTAKRAVGTAVPPRFYRRLLMIKPYPGLDYQRYNLDQVDVVLHDLYHSGTACVSNQWGEHCSLLEFVKQCSALNIKVYLAPAIQSSDVYQSTRTLEDAGAEMIWNMSIEAAYVKLMLAYGNFKDSAVIARFIHSDHVGECI